MGRNLMQDQFRLTSGKRHYERPTGISQTIPDETLTIKQIVEKHIKGQRIAETYMRTPAYDSGADFDSEDLEKVEHMDLFDREMFEKSNKEKIVEMQEKQKKLFSDKKKEEERKRQGKSRPTTASESEEGDVAPPRTTKEDAKKRKAPDDDVSEELAT